MPCLLEENDQLLGVHTLSASFGAQRLHRTLKSERAAGAVWLECERQRTLRGNARSGEKRVPGWGT
jgi:hypothetical protein